MPTYRLAPDDLTGEDVADLMRFHLAEAHRWSPPGSVHALPIDRLRQPDVSFFTARDGDRLAAIGALRMLGQVPQGIGGELKSMRAHPDYRGRGAGRAMLLHLMQVAQDRGCTWLGLETGLPEAFAPARALYRAHGFTPCPPFADYADDGFSLCMALRFQAEGQ